MIADVEVLSVIFGLTQALALLVAIVGGVIVLLYRWRTSNHVQRRGLEPVLLLGAAILALGLGLIVTNSSGGAAADVFQILFFGAFALVPWAFLLGLMRTASSARRPSAASSSASRRTRAASATRWPSSSATPRSRSRTGCPRPATSTGAGSRSSEPGRGRVQTEIENEGRRVGALIHDEVLCESPELLREAAAAAALALENVRLEVELRRGSRRCARPARARSRPVTPSAAGSAATCTTARSSGWSR